MNQDEIKTILLLYRPGTVDADDPQIAAVLALARNDPALGRWLEDHDARQNTLRDRFRQIAAPAGLKEQIISEETARRKAIFRQPRLILAAAASVVALLALTTLWFRSGGGDNTFAIYRSRMSGIALRGYAMDLTTNDPTQIRAYLARHGAPADYVLPAPLQKTTLTGCAIERWQGAAVSMICFRTARPLPPGQRSDLWLFVVERAAVKDAPVAAPPQLAGVNRLFTAAWTEGGKLYLLGTIGDERALRQFL
ncbi:MAG: hypothetical protein KGJ60_00195 [Verrucomicrobiota bacterium]|nr:hypothetical protein [Verrucomicrobiota bacterium]